MMDGNSLEHIKAKGIQKSVIKKFKRDLYFNKIFEEVQTYAKMNTIISVNQQLYSQTINKLAMNPYNDKVWLCKDGFRSYYYQ